MSTTKVVMSGQAKALLVALAALTAAVIGILTSFGAVRWNTAQTALVVAESAVFWAFVSALVAHLSRNTQQQPVAVAGTFTALVTATVSVGIGFSWWQASGTQNAYITSLVTALIAVASALVARMKVHADPTPERGVDLAAHAVAAAVAHPASANDQVKSISNGHSKRARV
jgi:hypothetical protein